MSEEKQNPFSRYSKSSHAGCMAIVLDIMGQNEVQVVALLSTQTTSIRRALLCSGLVLGEGDLVVMGEYSQKELIVEHKYLHNDPFSAYPTSSWAPNLIPGIKTYLTERHKRICMHYYSLQTKQTNTTDSITSAEGKLNDISYSMSQHESQFLSRNLTATERLQRAEHGLQLVLTAIQIHTFLFNNIRSNFPQLSVDDCLSLLSDDAEHTYNFRQHISDALTTSLLRDVLCNIALDPTVPSTCCPLPYEMLDQIASFVRVEPTTGCINEAFLCEFLFINKTTTSDTLLPLHQQTTTSLIASMGRKDVGSLKNRPWFCAFLQEEVTKWTRYYSL